MRQKYIIFFLLIIIFYQMQALAKPITPDLVLKKKDIESILERKKLF